MQGDKELPIIEDSKETPPSYPKPAYAWYVVGILTLAYISSFVDRQILSLLVDDIKRDMGISEFEISLLMGLSFAIFYTFLGLPIGRLADYKNRRNIIMIGIFVWSLMTALTGMVKNYWQFLLARIGVGVGEATLSPSAYSMITDYFPKERLATALSVYSMGIYLGTGISILIGGLVSSLASIKKVWDIPIIGEVYSWQMVFFIIGLPGLLVALLMLTVKEPIRRGVKVQKDKEASSSKAFFKYLGANQRTFWLHNFGFGLFTMTTYGASYWIPAFLIRNYGWTKGEVGLYYGMTVTVFATLGVVLGGRLADYLTQKGYGNGRQIVMLISSIGLLFTSLIIPFASREWVLPLLVFTNFFASFAFGVGTAVVQEISPPQMRAQASALFLFVVNLVGLGLGPSVVAGITEYILQDNKMVGFSIMYMAIFSLSIATLFFWLSIEPYKKSLLYLKEWTAKQ